MADNRKRDKKNPQPKPQTVDMGLGSREQGFKPQRPKPKSADREPSLT